MQVVLKTVSIESRIRDPIRLFGCSPKHFEYISIRRHPLAKLGSSLRPRGAESTDCEWKMRHPREFCLSTAKQNKRILIRRNSKPTKRRHVERVTNIGKPEQACPTPDLDDTRDEQNADRQVQDQSRELPGPSDHVSSQPGLPCRCPVVRRLMRLTVRHHDSIGPERTFHFPRRSSHCTFDARSFYKCQTFGPQDEAV